MKRKLFTVLCVLYVLFVVYNTLLPFRFDYGWHDLPARLQTINWHVAWHGPQRASLTDIGGNILLFVPLGFCLTMRLRFAHCRHPMVWAIVGSAVLSLAIEFAQLFIAARHSALHDVINNTLGGLIGAGAAMLYAVTLSASVTNLFYHLLAHRPVLLIVLAFGVCHMLAALMPFTVSITVSELLQNVKAINLGLLTQRSLGSLLLNTPTTHDAQPFDILGFWDEVIFWTVGGYVLTFCYRLYWQRRPYGKLLLFGAPLGYFLLVEGVQLLITSRVSDINDVLSGYLGVLIGMLLYALLTPLRRRTSRTVMDVLRLPLLLYVVSLLFSGWQPFDWTFSAASLSQKMIPQHLIPFYAYFQNTDLWNMYDLITAMLSFVPLSLYKAMRGRNKGQSWLTIFCTVTLLALLSGIVIEGMQLFSLSRAADITDVLSYGVGGSIGVFALYYYERQILPTLAILGRSHTGASKFKGPWER